MAMALFRHHVGVALPTDGAVWCQFTTNGGVTQEFIDERLRILPGFGTLRQGRKCVGTQFEYRYNCDGKATFAALVQFHRSLWFTLFASSDQRIVAMFEGPKFKGVPASRLVRPGGLLSIVPANER
jgi:hypothetical protein